MELIRQYDNLLTLDKTYNIDENNNYASDLIKKINLTGFLEYQIQQSKCKSYSQLFRLYLSLFNLFSEVGNEKKYFEYKKMLLRSIEFLSKDEIRFHIGRLIRYCMIRKAELNTRTLFNNELFHVYNIILLKGYFKSSLSDYLPVELFRSILQHSLEIRKFKWAYNFIKKYRRKLRPDMQRNMFYFSCAYFYFNRKLFGEAMKNFHKIDFNHFVLKIDLRNFMLMTYYELELFENALSLISAYKEFLIYDNVFSSSEKKRQRNFIYLIHKMILFKTSPKPYNKYLIQKHLENEYPYKEWINEKLNQLDIKYNKTG